MELLLICIYSPYLVYCMNCLCLFTIQEIFVGMLLLELLLFYFGILLLFFLCFRFCIFICRIVDSANFTASSDFSRGFTSMKVNSIEFVKKLCVKLKYDEWTWLLLTINTKRIDWAMGRGEEIKIEDERKR